MQFQKKPNNDINIEKGTHICVTETVTEDYSAVGIPLVVLVRDGNMLFCRNLVNGQFEIWSLGLNNFQTLSDEYVDSVVTACNPTN